MQKISPFSIPLILQCLLLIIPINLYVIGNWLATGIQWALFRYQQSYLGNSLILFYKDINYIASGAITGRSIFAGGFNVAASSLLLLALCIFVYGYLTESIAYFKTAAIITISGGCLFLISDIIQYGILFHGPDGFAIPLGVPAILLTGWWTYRREFPDT
jgi:hypothetical protein